MIHKRRVIKMFPFIFLPMCLFLIRKVVLCHHTEFNVTLWSTKYMAETHLIKGVMSCSGTKKLLPDGVVQHAFDLQQDTTQQTKVAVWMKEVSINGGPKKMYRCLPDVQLPIKDDPVSCLNPGTQETVLQMRLIPLCPKTQVFNKTMFLNCFEEKEITPDEKPQGSRTKNQTSQTNVTYKGVENVISKSPNFVARKNVFFSCSDYEESSSKTKSESDSYLEKNITEGSELLRKHMLEGIPDLNLLPLAPYKSFDYHLYQPSSSAICLNVFLPMITIYGLQNFILTSINAYHYCESDLLTTSFDLRIRMPYLHIQGIYAVEGWILAPGINTIGYGTNDIKFKQLDVNTSFVMFAKDGHLQIRNFKIHTKWEHFSCRFLGFRGNGVEENYYASLVERFAYYVPVHILPVAEEEMMLKMNKWLSFSFIRIFEKIMRIMRTQLK